MATRVTVVEPGLRVILAGDQPDLAPGVAARVKEIWEQETGRSPWLFEGRIFSLDSYADGECRGHWADYSRFVAQMTDPGLSAEIGVHPLGVMSLMWLDGCLVLGLRSGEVSQEPNCWDLGPSGGLSDQALTADGRLDYKNQLLQEITEELGLPARLVSEPVPLALVEDTDALVTDLLMELHGKCEPGELHRMFEENGSGEFREIALVPPEELKDFFASRPENLVASSKRVLEWRGLL